MVPFRIPYAEIPDGESLISGIFVYAMGNKPLSDGYAKTKAYFDENSILEAWFCVKGFQDFAATNESAPTVQLQSIMVASAVIARGKWNFRVVDVSRAFFGCRNRRNAIHV